MSVWTSKVLLHISTNAASTITKTETLCDDHFIRLYVTGHKDSKVNNCDAFPLAVNRIYLRDAQYFQMRKTWSMV